MELCIDFGGTEIKLAIIDEGHVLASSAVPVRGDVSDLASAADEARDLLTNGGRRPVAAGIAVPGVVDPATGRLMHANAKYGFLRGLDLDAWAREEFGLRAVIENDARAALIGETTTGSAADERDVVLVTLGTGIGTAAMIDGSLVRGRTGHAGILGGHVTVDVAGPVCSCGNVGCGEVLAAVAALRGVDPRLTMRDVFVDRAHSGVRDRFVHTWGVVVTTLVHAYDPAVVILSGGVLRAGDAVREPIEAYVRSHLWPSITPPQFIVPIAPELSVARGLGVLARGAAAHLEPEAP